MVIEISIFVLNLPVFTPILLKTKMIKTFHLDSYFLAILPECTVPHSRQASARPLSFSFIFELHELILVFGI